MILTCKKECLDENGKKLMNFTLGEQYVFGENDDPEGWWVLDDNEKKEVFFNLDIMFK